MKKIILACCFFATVLLWQGREQVADAQPAPFECPWTPVTGNAPFVDGCYGGGNDGCGGQDDSGDDPAPPSVPCEDQVPPMLTSPPPDFDFQSAVAQAISELNAKGIDISGANCGIIVEIACNYMPGGVGLLAKTWGHHYNGHSEDFIMTPDGRGWDVVIGCGGGNTPGVGNSWCCPATGCEPEGRFLPCPPLPAGW